jgi:hypothetical protein
MVFEVALVILWAHWVALPFLDYRETQWPIGREFGFQTQSHHLWEWLRQCGVCALWNGGINGGYPALAEVYGAPLHPLVAVTTLTWGTVVGAKLTVLYSLALAGVAQWWMARAMGLGAPARLWAGLAAVVGGHITGRMDLGGISLVLSTASASLALAAMLNLGINPRRKPAILLGVFGALAVLSGQGYMQVSLVAWAPFLLVFVWGDRRRLVALLRESAIALMLAFLLAGAFLVPLLHFWPNIHKGGDFLFRTAQPLEYIPLNLVIRDIDFMKTPSLGSVGIPHLYNLYIGWTPVLLAVLALILRRAADRRILLFLVGGIGTLFVLASAVPFRWLLPYAPWLATIKHTPLLAGLAVPGILALSAYGLHAVFQLPLPPIRLTPRRRSSRPALLVHGAWFLAIPLVSSLHVSFGQARVWFGSVDASQAYDMAFRWRTQSLEWVQPPWGVHYWLEAALHEGLKVSVAWYPWSWEGRDPPFPRIEATPGTAPQNAIYQRTEEGVRTYLHRDRQYAFVEAPGDIVPCMASGGAGDIVVECASVEGGTLVVGENYWQGWQARVDGVRRELIPGDWLMVQASPGDHVYRFRYLPWDVPVGVMLTMVGVVVGIALYIRADREGR